MAVSGIEFWQQITRIGIVDSVACTAWMKRFQAVVEKRAAISSEPKDLSQANDAVAVAQFLIAKQVVTKFQSQRLLAGRAGDLRIGDYLVLDRCDSAPLTRWCRGRQLCSPTECLLYPCSDALTSSRWVDLAWLRAHSAVSFDGLQPVSILTIVASDPWRGAIISELPLGRSLDQWVEGQKQGAEGKKWPDHATVASIGLLIANSLAAMHSAGLVHGEVRPSRVWCGEDQSLWLLRDAGRPAAHPDDPPQEHRWFDDDTIADLYAAPELAVEDAEPTFSSDLFSLGALLYRLATGDTVRQRGASYRVPATVIAATNAEAAGDPLMRTIAYAIDPNPEARFPDVDSFAKALNAVVSAYAAMQPPQPQAATEPAVAPVPQLPPPPAVIAQVESAVLRPPTPSDMKPKTEVRPFGLAADRSDRAVQSVGSDRSMPEPAKPEPTEPTVPAVPIATPTQTSKRLVRRRNRRSRRGPIIIGTVAVGILLGVFTIFLRPAAEDQAPRPRLILPPPPPTSPMVASGPSANTESKTSTATNVGSGSFELVQDDRLLWASPWSPNSKPPTLELIPPGSQLVLSLRLNRLVGDVITSSWLDWMGTEIKPAIADLEKHSGLKAEQIERLTIASSTGSDGLPKSTYTVSMREPIPLNALTKAWGVSPSRTKDGNTIYSGDEPSSVAYFVKESTAADSAGIQSFAFGPVQLVSLIADNDGEAIPLPRALQQLWDTTSEEADFIAMTVPNFLFADGREILNRFAPKAIDPLRALLIPDVAGAIVSMSLADVWYFETRLTPSGSVSAPAILQTIEPRIAALPGWAEEFTIDVDVDTSWRAIANRLPQFMRAISDQTRLGVSKSIPTANFYLPAEAAPQVTLATLLALSVRRTNPSVAATTESKPITSLTVEQLLDTHLSVSFDQESLQFAVAVIRDEFARSLPAGSKPPVLTIIGGDLEKLGITQNQQIRNFKIQDKPLRDALSELVRQANPDKSVTSLTDAKQTLVWVVESSAATPTIQISTRPAAMANKFKLSKEFSSE